ncbi:hypothetical protein [Actinoplanes sp. NPDC023714]|uniref:hypothetical protein n=1 Tax=Actinoplanes sp. NPDC023714 TaxID=3154322 RepID=UPI0033D87C79
MIPFLLLGFLGVTAVAGLAFLVWRRDRRTGNVGERPVETHEAGWLHKSEGI